MSPTQNSFTGGGVGLPVAFGDKLLFAAGTADNRGRELWATDGTPAGTRLLRDVLPGPGDGIVPDPAYPRDPTVGAVVGPAVLFAADDGVRGIELWATDGTPAGTRLVADLNPGADGSAPATFVRAGGKAFFTASDDAHGRGVWAVPLTALE